VAAFSRVEARKDFRTITYNGIGNGAFLAVVAIPRINNLRIINALDSSTPAASTIIKIIINGLQATKLSLQCSNKPLLESSGFQIGFSPS
jgi:hypothetical protein